MYKLLLSWRYLRTRFIALASIVSVTLGVATLIVVNSVMAGFVDEMKARLHGILSDVEIASPGIGEEIEFPETVVQEIRNVVGDDLLAVTHVVRVPALMNFEYRGRNWTQQIMLMGIDENSYGDVTEFLPFLLNENKQKQISFDLEEDGYDSRLKDVAGWSYRRAKAENQRKIDELMSLHRASYDQAFSPSQPPLAPSAVSADEPAIPTLDSGFALIPLPAQVPDVEAVVAEKYQTAVENAGPNTQRVFSAYDPNDQFRPEIAVEDLFDPARDQHTGIILGLAIAHRKYVDPETGEVDELFMLRPGDDVHVTMPTAGSSISPISEKCTLVDFYSSNMHEYDSSFAFMPLRQLQELRGMIHPVTGASSVTSIQIKVKDGANLSEIRDKLTAKFHVYPWVIQTWQDTQRPLLSAVHLELAILNILLFLIIAVAGFGILATFYMIVVEKTKDIGILKALGAPSKGVMSIFLGYGLSLGAVGTGVGIALGLVFVTYINQIANLVQYITGQEVFDPTIYYFSEIPTIVNPAMVGLVAVGAIAIAILASVLPALRAARLHPVEALRYE